MKNFILSNLAILCLSVCLSGIVACSNISKNEAAEAGQVAALAHEQKAQKTKDARVSSLTRQVQLILDAPVTPKTLPVADQLLSLSLKLTGPADMSDSDLIKQNLELMGTIEQNKAQIARIQADDDDKTVRLEKSQDEVKAKTAKLYAVANGIAIGLDNANSFITKIWIIGGLIAAFFVFALLCKLGIFTGKAAATIAAKVP